MAGIAIPLIEALGPSVISLIAGIVHKEAPKQEAANGPGTGPVKFANVFDAAMNALQVAANAGQIDKNLPSPDVVKVLVQTLITAFKLPGGVLADVPAVTMPVPVSAATPINLTGTANFSVVGGTLQLQQVTK